MDNTAKQNQTQGLKTRLGKSFGKFSKAGSLWHWTFQWANNMQKQDGYDSGMIETNYDVFQRLKLRFFDGVLLNKHFKGQNYSELIAGGNVFLRTNPNAEHNREDILMFSFTITWDTDIVSGKKYRKVRFILNEANCRVCKLTRGQVKYMNELFGSYELQIKSQYGIKTDKVDVLAMLAASVPSKNVESAENTSNSQAITAAYTQKPQTENRTGVTSLHNIMGSVLNVATPKTAQVANLGKQKFSDFVHLINKLNPNLALMIAENIQFVSLDDTFLTLGVKSKKVVDDFENGADFADFINLFRNMFGAIKLQYQKI